MAKPPNPEFAKRLKALIDESSLAGMTQDVWSKRFGVSNAMVTYYLKGEKLPSVGTAITIAKEIGCCVEYLLTGRGPRRVSDIPLEERNVLDIGQLDKSSQSHIEALFHSMLNAQDKRGNGTTKN